MAKVVGPGGRGEVGNVRGKVFVVATEAVNVALPDVYLRGSDTSGAPKRNGAKKRSKR